MAQVECICYLFIHDRFLCSDTMYSGSIMFPGQWTGSGDDEQKTGSLFSSPAVIAYSVAGNLLIYQHQRGSPAKLQEPHQNL